MSERVRGGKHGLRGHRRELLSPFSEAEKRLKQLSDPSPEETATFHGLHRLFAYATELKQGIWEVRSSEDLARAAGLEWLIASIRSSSSRGDPSADSTGRSRSPPEFPDPSVEVVASSSSRAGPRPSSRPGTPPRPLNISKIGVFFDCHGVLDKSVDQSQQLIQSLREKYPALRLYCLSFAPSDWRQRQVSDFCEELDPECLLTVEKFGQRGKRACLATVAERDNLQFAFFLDDQDRLARDVGRLGSWVTTRVLCENESILAAEAPIAAFIAQCREKLHRPDVRDRDQI